jgi:hypothetical protein
MAVNLSPVGGVAAQFFDNSGNPLTGGKLYTYTAGTTTPAATYTSSNGATAWTNPIVLDAAGRVPSGGEIWLTDGINYKFILKDANDVTIATYDNISGISSATTAAGLPFTGFLGQNGTVQDLADDDGSDWIGYQPPGTTSTARSAQSKMRDVLSVKDFGALGDGTGSTPIDTGDDISNASWNTWNNTPFKDDPSWSPFYANPSGTFQPPRVKPFANDDTWDYIGCNLALWYAGANAKSTYFPAGAYVMNAVSSTPKGAYQGLLIMKGQEQTIYGEGPYESFITWKEDATYFNTNNVGSVGYYKLFELYRTGGPPTNIYNMGFSGPGNYSVTAQNITLINCENINGVTFRDLWLTTGWYGISSTTNGGDSHIKGCTSEFLFGVTVYTDATSDFTIDFVNFWASAIVVGQKGIVAGGRVAVTNSRFVEFFGESIVAASGVISNNLFACRTAGSAVILTSNGVISGNQFTGGSGGPMVAVVSNVSITGNYFKQDAEHSCIDFGNGNAGSATYVSIVGNTFIKTDGTVADYNNAILAPVNNVNYYGAMTRTVLIANNTFQGRAATMIGDANLINNIFSSVDGIVNTRGDIQGNQIASGSSSAASFTITVSSGMIDQGNGSARAQQRVTLLNVIVYGTDLELRGVAIYSNRFNGNALLLGTLGSQAVNGTITFGSSGANPTIAITNTTGNAANYVVTEIPLT